MKRVRSCLDGNDRKEEIANRGGPGPGKGRRTAAKRAADAVIAPGLTGGAWFRLVRATYRVRIALGVVVLASAPLLPRATDRQRLTLAIITAVVYLPYSVGLALVARRRETPAVRLAGLAGDLLVVFMFQAVVPPTRIAALFGYLLISAFYTTIGGIRAGALVAAASIALTLVAEAMSPSPLIDAYTLVLFGAVMAVQAAILPAAVGELERIVDRSPDALLLVDADGRVRYASSEAERLLNADRGTLLGSPLEPTIDLTRSREVAVELPGGERRLVEPRVSTVSGPGGPLSVIGLRDVTDRVREEERFRELALRDELTGLYNRRGFLVLSEQHLKLASRTGTSPLVLYMDVVGLKGINDTWGHAEGDRALRAVGDALAETFRGSDVLARVGGDEFCALLWGPTEENVAIERLGDTLARRGSELRLKYKLQVAAGTARFDPLKPRSTHELMDAADRSMYAEGRRAGAR